MVSEGVFPLPPAWEWENCWRCGYEKHRLRDPGVSHIGRMRQHTPKKEGNHFPGRQLLDRFVNHRSSGSLFACEELSEVALRVNLWHVHAFRL